MLIPHLATTPPAARQPFLAQAATSQPTSEDAPLSPAALEILRSENVSSPEQLKDPAHRAQLSFEALKTNMGGTAHLLEKRNGERATAWPYGQTMVAALDAAKLTGSYADFEALASNLAIYREPDGGYGPLTDGQKGKGDRFYDDNAWIGLAFVQAYSQTQKPQYLDQAKEVFNFIKTAQQPDGGLIWVENAKAPTYNTCTEGPAAELALRLHLAGDQNDEYLHFGEQVYQHMHEHLLISTGPRAGLYADKISTDLKHRSDDIWSYNEGTPVGAGALLFRITGDQQYLDQARATAQASLQYFGQDNALWKQPPAFSAVYLRNLLQLNDPLYQNTLKEYNSQVWTQALNPQSGLFDRSCAVPLGHYGDPAHMATIDQAALVQLQAIEAMPASFYPELT